MNQLHNDCQCENCGHCFNEKDAKCDNSRIHENSFACPKCNSCISKTSPLQQWKERTGLLSKHAILFYLLLALVIVAIWFATYYLVKYTSISSEVGMAIKIIVYLVLIYKITTSKEIYKTITAGIRKYATKNRINK